MAISDWSTGSVRVMAGGPSQHRANLRGLGLTPAEVEKAMADLFGPAKPAPVPFVAPPPPPPKPAVAPIVAPVFIPPPPPRPVVAPPPPSKLNWLAVAASAGAGFVAGGPPGALVGAGAGFWIGRPK